MSGDIVLPTHRSFKNLIGQKFGRLLVVEYAGASRNGRTLWKCKCECGQAATIRSDRLPNGNTESCGCLQRDRSSLSTKTHGMRQSPEYGVWTSMVQRCHNPNCKRYQDYGGRGICVCQEWRDSFAAFLSHVGPRPSPSHQIDRIDNARGYEPGNTRWATIKENNRNRRNNRLVTYGGETLCLAEWSERTGIHAGTIRSRLNRGWNAEAAATTPSGPQK